MKIISKSVIQKNTLTRFWPFLTKLDSLWTTYLTTPFWQRYFWMALKGDVHKLCRLKIGNFLSPPPPYWDAIVYGRPQTSLTLGLSLRLNLSRKLLSTFYEIFKLFHKIWFLYFLWKQQQFIAALRIFLLHISLVFKQNIISLVSLQWIKTIHASFKSLYLLTWPTYTH